MSYFSQVLETKSDKRKIISVLYREKSNVKQRLFILFFNSNDVLFDKH